METRSLTLRDRDFIPFWLYWGWPWRDDLHILPRDLPDVQIWTFYVKTFHSYCLTDIQTDTTEITYHAASRVVKTDETRKPNVWQYVLIHNNQPKFVAGSPYCLTTIGLLPLLLRVFTVWQM